MPKQEKDKPKRKWPEKDTDEYCEKRSQNNVAVRKSRDRARQKQTETKQRVDGLKAENNQLEGKVDTLKKELSVLKGIFTSHAAGTVAPQRQTTGETHLASPSVGLQPSDPIQLDHVYSNCSSPTKQSPSALDNS